MPARALRRQRAGGGHATPGPGLAAGAGGTGARPGLVVVVSMGNPHAVQLVDDVDQFPVAVVGPQIERHARFPQRVNAGFMQILNRAQTAARL
jgi:diaminopimelate epimerase